MLVGLGRLPFKSLMFGVVALLIVMGAVLDSPSSTASANEPAADTFTISLGSPALVGAHASAVTALAPGDTLRRPLDVSLSSRLGSKVALKVISLGTKTLLDTDTRNGLQLAVDRCVSLSGWRRVGTAYVCNGAVVHLLGRTAVATVKDRRLALTTMTTGRTQHLLLSFRLPPSAGNAFEHLVSWLRLTFSVRR